MLATLRNCSCGELNISHPSYFDLPHASCSIAGLFNACVGLRWQAAGPALCAPPASQQQWFEKLPGTHITL